MFTGKLSTKCRGLPHTSCPHKCLVSLINMGMACEFLRSDEPIVTYLQCYLPGKREHEIQWNPL